MFGPAVFRQGFRAELPDSGVTWIPGSRNVTAWSRA